MAGKRKADAKRPGDQPKKSGRKPPPKQYQFKKGQSGNPSGRPKGSISLTSRLRKLLRENPERADRILDNLLNLAEAGDFKALGFIRETFDRIDGPVAQAMRLEGEDGGPIKITIRRSGEGK